MASRGSRPARYFNQGTDKKSGDTDFQRSGFIPQKKFRPPNRVIKEPKTPEERVKLTHQKRELSKKRQEKKRRLIIRNLSFKVEEEELKNVLSQFGNVVELLIPKKPDGKKKGFAFAQFDNFHSSLKAIQKLNFQKIKGRPVAVDYAISKSKYEHVMSSRKVSKVKEESSEEDDKEETQLDSKDLVVKQEPDSSESSDDDGDDDDKRVSKFMKELDFKNESEDEKDDDDSDSSESDDEQKSESFKESSNNSVKRELDDSHEEDSDDDTDKTAPNKSSPAKKAKLADDTHEGKTVFMRNISFETSNETLKEAMSEFGSLQYCLLCVDPMTELPRGTAFLKFENKTDADKLIEKASDESSGGVFLDGRRLYCSLALSRDELQKKVSLGEKVKSDKRNLYLLKEGIIMADSEEAEGVSSSDVATRAKLEASKKQKLKNLNFFVSKTRLCVHNIPPNYSDKDLRKLFKKAVGRNAVLTEARVMKDMKKVNEQGEARSKGFGFVAFRKHDDALQALRKLNNDPKVFNNQKRPIVEFSVENHLALLSKQRRREKSALKQQKSKETENTETDNKSNGMAASHTKNARKRQRNKKVKSPVKSNKEAKVSSTNLPSSPSKKQTKKKRKGKSSQNQDNANFKNKVDGYKKMLMQKL